jgi:hypothetical protein
MRRPGLAASAALALIALVGVSSSIGANDSGFKTAQAPMLNCPSCSEVTPVLTVGDRLGSGYRFEAIPDGISVRTRGQGRADLYVNHETSKVPFPYNTANPTAANGESDFDNAQVSRLILNQHSAGVLNGSFVIPSSAGYQRFCSNYLATSREGFDRDIFFTNEESPDYVLRREDSWPPALTDPNQEENGVVVALDAKTSTFKAIYGMGRHNHENNVPVPGYGKPVVLSGDDTFTSGPLTIPPGGPLEVASVPSQSQLYSYIAPNTAAVLNDQGDLWAFVSDTPGFDDALDFTPGSTTSIEGHFVKVPKDIATGRNPDGTDLMSADKGYPAPPNDGTWQRDPSGVGIDGPQWVLEHWGDIQPQPVFQFVRVEDTAYDKRPDKSNVVYIVDSGRGTTGAPGAGKSTNGRVWKMVLDPNDPTKVLSLSILIEGDDSPVKTPTEIHQPDNIESTANSLLITEDPGSSQQFPFGSDKPGSANFDPSATTARLWGYNLATGTMAPVAKVDQSADEGPTDVDSAGPGNLGAWESSGVVDASSVFGPGAFLIDVQSHSLWVEKAAGDDNFAPAGPDFTFKREGGQLLLIRIPGA